MPSAFAVSNAIAHWTSGCDPRNSASGALLSAHLLHDGGIVPGSRRRTKMPSSLKTFRTLRIAVLSFTIVVALGYFSHVRAQSGTPPAQVVPLRPLAPLSSVAIPDVPGLSNFVASRAEAIALGKTLFWD